MKRIIKASSDLRHLFYPGQKVVCRMGDDIDDYSMYRGKVVSTNPDHIIVDIPEISDHCYFDRDMVGDVYPDYNINRSTSVQASYWDRDEDDKEISEDHPWYCPPRGPEEDDWDFIAESVARQLSGKRDILGPNTYTTESVIEAFRNMNDDFDDWWARGLRDEESEKEVVDQIVNRLERVHGFPKIKDNTFASTDIWNPVLECNDDDDNPTVWAAEINNEYGKFVWIEKYGEHEFHVTVCDPEWRTLTVCKSLSAAKRWISMKIGLCLHNEESN